MRIILIRHGEVPGNKEKRYIGRTDQSLSEVGRIQASSVKLAPISKVYSSPYLRCVQSAKLIFPNRNPIVCNDLRECDFGQFEGKNADELVGNEAYRVWVDGGCLGQIPDGESVQAFKQRCGNAFEKIVRFEAGKSDCLAFVVHGGVIMSILERFDERKLDFYAYYLKNCAYVCYDCEMTENQMVLRVMGEEPC